MNAIVEKCDCDDCKNKHDFELPKDLISDLKSGKIAIFAGAGISTESKSVLKFTLYDDVAWELKYDQCNLPFPELMQEYCNQINGRIKLLAKIRDRFKHIKSFPELYSVATRFHESMSTLFPLKTIVTTNWDTYFEDECNATPFVSDQDLAFWESDDRRVLKIHGSINNYGSIVATTKDYEACQERLRNGLIGGLLKTLLATKTVVFVGYSLSDPDFRSIFEFVSEQMRGLQRQAFVITPFKEEGQKFEQLGLIPIVTDGEYFISNLKEHFVNQGEMLSDDIYYYADVLDSIVRQEHIEFLEKYSCFDHPQIIYAASYQDGMMHATGRAHALKCSGEYSDPCNFRRVLHPYLVWQKQKLKDKKYEDVAYIEGYINGLMFLQLNDDEKNELKHPPLYYAFGVKRDLFTLEDYKDVIEELPQSHKASYQRAKRMVNGLKSTGGIVFHHPPWL
jgi:NAD-dependent SIR2 family protein deacetylase